MSPLDSNGAGRREHGRDVDGARHRFAVLVRSPLRSALLRYLHTHAPRAFSLEEIVNVFARIPQDLDNCLRDLVSAGLASRTEEPAVFAARRPAERPDVLDEFLSSLAGASVEDESPAARQLRDLVGRDERMLVVFDALRMAAKSDLPVIILGPTGSGKEIAARTIHELSRRRARRLEAINCAAVPDTLFEAELFGYERGAFTGAVDRRQGRVELAGGGTLFLDEIADLGAAGQAKLLRVLAERKVERLGGRESTEVDFRLVSATNRPLEALVQSGQFREDLYYRVNAFPIRLPSLRERAGDIPLLAERFLRRACAACGLSPDERRLAPNAIALLTAYHWPGNVRELENVMGRVAVAARSHSVTAADLRFLQAPEQPPWSEPTDGLVSLRDAERAHIQRVLDALGWNKVQAARVLGVGRATLYRKIEGYHLEPAASRLDRLAS